MSIPTSRDAETKPEGTAEPTATARAGSPSTDTPQRCGNCGAELQGPHCYACGQPTKGLVRHFGSILGDFFDSVFDLDSRLIRTLGPLLLRPGHLSREYFSGRRVRYVSPVRLFVFLIVLTFFLAQISFDWSDAHVVGTNPFSKATTVEDVLKQRDEALAEIDKAIQEAGDTPGAAGGLAGATASIKIAAQQRIEQIRKADGLPAEPQVGNADTDAPAPPVPPLPALPRDSDTSVAATDETATPASRKPERLRIDLGEDEWDPDTHPLAISWLPDSANAWLNQRLEITRDNAERIREDPNLMRDALFGLLPQVLFVLMPIFALLLKFTYIFRKRLYMEHLIVALHSHAFLALSLSLMMLFGMLRGWLGDGFLHSMLGWLELALLIWMPLYLLLSQKRVYQQGWIMTGLKFSVLGLVYIVLLSLALVVASFLSVATL